MSRNVLKTGELAKMAGVNKETIRFYEQKGLLSEPVRTSGGYRQYTQNEVSRLIFIRNAKSLGFSLSEIMELLAIADGSIDRCGDVRKIAEDKLDHINTQLHHLQSLKSTLTNLVDQCAQTSSIHHCPIIESLSKGTQQDEN